MTDRCVQGEDPHLIMEWVHCHVEDQNVVNKHFCVLAEVRVVQEGLQIKLSLQLITLPCVSCVQKAKCCTNVMV